MTQAIEVFGKGLTDAQKAFSRALLSGMPPDQARSIAGYADTVSPTGLLANPRIRHAVQEGLRARLAGAAPMALETLIQLLGCKSHPRVQLEAARAILDRAGHVAPRPETLGQERDTRPVHMLTRDELAERIAALSRELSDRATPILELDSEADSGGSDTQAIDIVG